MSDYDPQIDATRDDVTLRKSSLKLAPDPAAAPLGTDDEAGGATGTHDRVEMAREAELRIREAAERRARFRLEDR